MKTALLVAFAAMSFDHMPRYVVIYTPGIGEDVSRATARTRGREVVAGDYFARTKRGRVAFDLVIIKGKIAVPYQQKRHRPVLVISRWGKMRIERPYRPQEDDYYAMAGSITPVYPSKKLWRRVVILESPHKLKFSEFIADHRQTKTRLERAGVPDENFMFLDGGSSVCPRARVALHIVRRW